MSSEIAAKTELRSYELIDSVRQEHTSVDAALSWARQYINIDSYERAEVTPRSITLKIHGEDGDRILKMVPGADSRQIELLQNLSLTLSNQSPSLLMSHDENGWLLYEHGQYCGINISHEDAYSDQKELLIAYANVQISASQQLDLLGDIECVNSEDQYKQLLSFLSPTQSSPALDGRVDGAFYLGAETANRYHRRLSSAADDLVEFLHLATPLTPMLEHCNLSLKCIARHSDGQLVFCDWDEATIAPSGLSLQSFFAGCHRPYLALRPPRPGRTTIKSEKMMSEDRMLLACYAKPLVDAGMYSTDSLRVGLPASITAGVMRNIAGYGDFPTMDLDLKKPVGAVIKQRLDDLMELLDTLSLGPGEVPTELTSI